MYMARDKIMFQMVTMNTDSSSAFKRLLLRDNLRSSQLCLRFSSVTCVFLKNKIEATGWLGRACSSWSWDHEFKPHTGGRDYIKKLKIIQVETVK